MRTDRRDEANSRFFFFFANFTKASKNGDSGLVQNGCSFLPDYSITFRTKTVLVSEIPFSSYIMPGPGCDVTSLNCLQYVPNFKKDERPAETG